MNLLTWTDTQRRRLKELDAGPEDFSLNFSTPEERDRQFQEIEKRQVRHVHKRLRAFFSTGLKPKIENLTEKLSHVLNHHGFARVSTPTIISRAALARMTVDENHPLSRQVYWLNDRQCLRPMLAPNLYSLMRDFQRLKHRPVRFFEIGSCFRKESDGARHNSEFTMLNLVEMGLPEEERHSRLEELGGIVAEAAGLTDYRFGIEKSKVYGTTLDVMSGKDDVEVASGAMGPHPLDPAWGITDTWVGLGFGLERLVMMVQGSDTISKWGKSLSYVNGIRLSL